MTQHAKLYFLPRTGSKRSGQLKDVLLLKAAAREAGKGGVVVVDDGLEGSSTGQWVGRVRRGYRRRLVESHMPMPAGCARHLHEVVVVVGVVVLAGLVHKEQGHAVAHLNGVAAVRNVLKAAVRAAA